MLINTARTEPTNANDPAYRSFCLIKKRSRLKLFGRLLLKKDLLSSLQIYPGTKPFHRVVLS